jgi:exodeoxyribonuclease-3
VAHPGLTWTPTTRRDDPKDHHDRIDFLLVRGLRPVAVQIVGEDRTNADLVVAPYPTDHRGVVATFAVP